jgi:hypothetical protein
MITLISREEAKAAGLVRYFTGVKCRNSHVDERYLSTGTCITCHRNNMAKFREKHRKQYNAASRDWMSQRAQRRAAPSLTESEAA